MGDLTIGYAVSECGIKRKAAKPSENNVLVISRILVPQAGLFLYENRCMNRGDEL